MAQVVRTLVKGRLYLRKRDLAEVADPQEVVKAFRVRSFDEMTCKRCPNLESRFSRAVCGPCPAYHGQIDLAEEITIERKHYISFPLGAQRGIEKQLDIKLRIPKGHDLRKYPRMAKKYKVIIDLYDGTPAPDGTTRINQKKAVDDWLDAGGVGVIRAGPRSGKTVLAVAISVELGVKTLVVTDSTDLLNQFWDTYSGDGKKRARVSNIPGKRVIRINKMEDFLKPHDVALINYQKFIRDTADARIKTFINGKYGLLIGDEVHMASAQAYASFLLKLDIPLRLGLSATPRRKDGRYCCQKGSKVLMADGARKNIEEIVPGDEVACYDHATEFMITSSVSNTFTRPASPLVEIAYEGGTLRCTPDHELWCENRKAYVQAKDLTVNDVIIIDVT